MAGLDKTARPTSEGAMNFIVRGFTPWSRVLAAGLAFCLALGCAVTMADGPSPAASAAMERARAEALQRQAAERRKQIPGPWDDAKHPERPALREQAQREELEAGLLAAAACYELAAAHPPQSAPWKENLSVAQRKYGDLYREFPTLAGGLFARMWEGRLERELGQTDQSLEVFRGLLASLPDDETFGPLRDRTMVLLLETLVSGPRKNYAEAAAKAEAWTEPARGREAAADVARIHYLAGQALLEHGRSLPADDPRRGDRLRSARQHLAAAARAAGPEQRDAQRLLADPLLGDPSDLRPAVDYATARLRGDVAWAQMLGAQDRLRKTRLPAAGDTAAASARRKAQQEFNDARDRALGFYRVVLRKKPSGAAAEQLGVVRFRMSYLSWAAGDLARAAILGEFLARSAPRSAEACPAAAIAMKALRGAWTEAAWEEDRPQQAERLRGLAEYVTATWPGRPEAAEGWMLLVDMAAERRDVPKALEYLGRIPVDSPQRGAAEGRAGQAFWAAAVQAVRLPAAERPSQAEWDHLVRLAEEHLREGIRRMRAPAAGPVQGTAALGASAPGATLVESELALAQVELDAGRPQDALGRLEDPDVGPLALTILGNPLTEDEAFRLSVYATALRACARLRQFDNAQKTLFALEADFSGQTVEGRLKWLATCGRLSRDLQEALTRLRVANRFEELGNVAQGCQIFLTRISEGQSQSAGLIDLYWAAQTWFALGAGLDPRLGKPPADVESCYREALGLYRAMEARCRKDPRFAPEPQTALEVRVRLAACLRALGQYSEALGVLVEILRGDENRIDVQVEAARTYQQWGQEDPTWYDCALHGSQGDQGRFLVWGWGAIATRVESLPGSRAIFHEARYNLAWCRMRRALDQPAPERAGFLKLAALDVLRVYESTPGMGGPEWRAKYDALFREIQQHQGLPPTGLRAAAEALAQTKSPGPRGLPAERPGAGP
jgi:tetratricopeptide (TPR) repeat protein